jgi:hypothetical protein
MAGTLEEVGGETEVVLFRARPLKKAEGGHLASVDHCRQSEGLEKVELDKVLEFRPMTSAIEGKAKT